MDQSERILVALKEANVRMTVARRAIVRIFAAARSPLTVGAALEELRAIRVRVNKTTVYRELKFLEAKRVLRSIQFDERNRRYELVPSEHRHHLICTSCKKIDDVVLDHDLDHVEATLTAQKKFKVQRHALEFYGLCESCDDDKKAES